MRNESRKNEFPAHFFKEMIKTRGFSPQFVTTTWRPGFFLLFSLFFMHNIYFSLFCEEGVKGKHHVFVWHIKQRIQLEILQSLFVRFLKLQTNSLSSSAVPFKDKWSFDHCEIFFLGDELHDVSLDLLISLMKITFQLFLLKLQLPFPLNWAALTVKLLMCLKLFSTFTG